MTIWHVFDLQDASSQVASRSSGRRSSTASASPDLQVNSIIAVQGLWANPNYTWTNNRVNWLQDLLPLDLPSARIFSFEPMDTPKYSMRKARRKHFVYLCGTIGVFLTILFMKSSGIASLLAFIGSALSLIAPLLDSLRTTRKRLATTFSTELEDEAQELLSCIRMHCLDYVRC